MCVRPDNGQCVTGDHNLSLLAGLTGGLGFLSPLTGELKTSGDDWLISLVLQEICVKMYY